MISSPNMTLIYAVSAIEPLLEALTDIVIVSPGKAL
jgi:hypothetical protein